MEPKNIFDLHKDILSDYKLYIDSFINIADNRILETVKRDFDSGSLYPEPLIQFNPSFESGGKVENLIDAGILARDFNNIFYDETGNSWSIYKHQTEAIIKGNEGKGFVVTSGTGSGKSLTYISTIFNHLFKNPNKPGIKAIIVYPLNALINSQETALMGFEENFRKRTGHSLPFTFAKYTGQEKQDYREKVIANPPDILLTNYMMLELLMVRKADENLRKSFLDNLEYLVFDELHVYKGRQGADVSLLNRRIKAAAKNKNIICIGTSATMATGTIEEQKNEVAKVATRFFDATFFPENVITESLTYSTNEVIPSPTELKDALNSEIWDKSPKAILENYIAIWLERTIAVRTEGENKRRNSPKSLKTIAAELSAETGVIESQCEQKIIEVLIWAESLNITSATEKKKDTILPFKLHQFISQTGYVYVTLENAAQRHVTLEPNPFVKLPESRQEVPVFQTVFSRISGEEFICVRKDFTASKLVFRDFNENQNPKNEDDLKANDGDKVKKVKDRLQNDYKDGYILFDKGYPLDITEYIDLLPSAWKNKSGEKIGSAKELLLPKEIYVHKDGSFADTPNGGEKAWFMPAPLIYDPTCGLIYLEPKLSEKTKLISLGNEGRSTSTTLITLQTLLALYKHGKGLKEQKLMSFTDNRQDASLQAGHFNDFIQVVHLRSAIEKVLRDSAEPLRISDLIFKVQEALNLPENDYATNPAPNPARPDEDNLEALRNYITYRIIQDLKRGWRYILPNLEQTALLEITYKNIEKDAADDTLWNQIDLLKDWAPEKRKDFILQVLNYFRNMYAVDYDMLRYENRLRIESELNQQLNKEKLWSLDKGERLDAPNFLSVQGADKATRETFIQSIGPLSRLARFIKHEYREAGTASLDSNSYSLFMTAVLDALTEAHYLKKVKIKAEKSEKDAYQLILTKVLWKRGDGDNVAIDKTSFITLGEKIKIKPHLYFQKLYREDFSKLPKSYIAAEHTGQISSDQKIEREEKFNEAAELSALYCSPTMELGIDISSLNIVHMRNVPPSPANYAQRSGRAGRSGQSALVFTYASKVSPHDKHYFANPVKMVSGIVQAPRIDLTNEELIRSHINATVLSFLNAEEFKPSLIDLIDISGRTYKLKSDLKAKYQNVIDSSFLNIKHLALKVVANIDFREVKWFNDTWLETQIRTVPDKLENALLRWRKMYLDALRQMNEAHETHISPVIKDAELKKLANLSYMRAKDRKNLLENQSDKSKNSTLSEFYTFRYLASEGFLPGYNFTRLPIRVFLGGKDRNESISRPRFIGLKEFGPNNLIYHNGGKYKVNRITPNDVSLDLVEIKISKETNYAFLGKDEGKGKNQDPITGTQFTASNIELYQNLLELEEAQSENSERISCMEEVRTSEGYVTELYLNAADGLVDATKIRLTVDGDDLMKLFYAPAAKLILLNKKWKRGRDDGFDIGTKTGFFKTKKQLERPNPEDPHANIMLYTYDTSDILYVQPIKSLDLTIEGIVTIQYALEKAIEQIYNIEPVEIGARLMGSEENKNVMLFESAEGSIGVLKDIARNPAMLRKIFLKAYEICGYDYATKTDKFPARPKASYDDLLSYYNQMDHTKIDRHAIVNALELLILSNPDDTVGGSYEGKYEELIKGLHHRSPGEKGLLDYLFTNGFRLPDYTNYNMEQFYVQPDFVFEKEKALIFVDGGIHKKAVNKADDEKKRKTIELAGFDVLVWDYTTEQVESFVTRRQDIFRKVR
ncbi:DEAD/DEAH box helicase [Haliscomenobacter hydrossis]|uniref:DEAD/DEAH box helicase domain protein n=1 Tax=Haliscomenobacter hydrossis (strain ATCC 27775 / DSM 1100 / LMG 10767 / O) TaxID=760192 RepID=F4L305_HALH1|nr:DEAD/DEAH box helicase [Haliscomenobacter hydrossis]AEE50664.1 DEAD/DEAH box helicase domain protein [Haliscomenobacter hydrossis DSM 1100]